MTCKKNILIVAAFGTAVLAATAHADTFSGDWGLDTWSMSGIAGGVASIMTVPDNLTCEYHIDLGGGGVPQQSGTYSVMAPSDGQVCFDWQWTGFHSWSASYAGLQLFADGPGGTEIIDLVEYHYVFATFDYSGEASIAVHAGYNFGLIVTGENYDADSRVSGTVTLTDWAFAGDSLVLGFYGDFWPSEWTASGMPDGVVSIGHRLDLPASGARLNYYVNLGGGGVSYRESSYTSPIPAAGTVELDWSWTGFHSWSSAYGGLRIEVAGPDGVEVIELVEYGGLFGSFAYSGHAEFMVYEGYSYSVIVAGENFDSDSRLLGTVELSDFDIDAPVVDPCPGDVNGDGVVDVPDLLELLAAWGPCP